MKHKRNSKIHYGFYDCLCGYHGSYRQVGSHIGFYNRRKGFACDVKFKFLKWDVIVKEIRN